MSRKTASIPVTSSYDTHAFTPSYSSALWNTGAEASTSGSIHDSSAVEGDIAVMPNTNATLPPMPYQAASHKRSRDEYEDYGNQIVNGYNYAGIDPEVAALVPPRRQKGRRPKEVPGGADGKTFKCSEPDCHWAFSRKEHLKRHEKTHSQERPFECDVPLCGLRFSRLDNLTSHKKTHEKGKRTTQWHIAKIYNQNEENGPEGQEESDGSLSPYDERFVDPGDMDVPTLPPLPPSHVQYHTSYSIQSYSEDHLADLPSNQLVESLLGTGTLSAANPPNIVSQLGASAGTTSKAGAPITNQAPAVALAYDDEDDLTEEEDNLYIR